MGGDHRGRQQLLVCGVGGAGRRGVGTERERKEGVVKRVGRVHSIGGCLCPKEKVCVVVIYRGTFIR